MQKILILSLTIQEICGFNIVALSNNKKLDNIYKSTIGTQYSEKTLKLTKVNNINKLYNHLDTADLIFLDKEYFINDFHKKLINLYSIPVIDYTKFGYIHNIKLINNEPYDFYVDTLNEKRIKMYSENLNLKIICSKQNLTTYDIKKIDNSIKTIDNLYNSVNIKFLKRDIKYKFVSFEDFMYYIIFKKINERYYLENKYSGCYIKY